MRKLFNLKRKISNEDVMNFEMVLGSVMQPVSPRQEFVRSLQTKMLTSAYSEEVKIEEETRKNILILVLSLMGVTVILGVWVRVIISILMLFGVTLNIKRGPKKRRVPVVHYLA